MLFFIIIIIFLLFTLCFSLSLRRMLEQRINLHKMRGGGRLWSNEQTRVLHQALVAQDASM